MNKVVKENLALIAGVCLPLLLVAFFFAARIPQQLIDDPEYSLIFATNYNPDWKNHPWHIEVDNKQLRIRHVIAADKDQHYYNQPKIYVYDHESKQSNLLDIDYENIIEHYVQDSTLDEIGSSQFITKQVSPDGVPPRVRLSFFKAWFNGRNFWFWASL